MIEESRGRGRPGEVALFPSNLDDPLRCLCGEPAVVFTKSAGPVPIGECLRCRERAKAITYTAGA